MKNGRLVISVRVMEVGLKDKSWFCSRRRVACYVTLLTVVQMSLFAGVSYGNNIKSLRLAVEDLIESYPDDYEGGPGFLERISQYEKTVSALKPEALAKQADELNSRIDSLRREAMIANPLVNRQPFVYVVRDQYKTDHHNTATMFQNNEINTGSFQGGSAIKIVDFGNDGSIKTLIDFPKGVARDLEISFDAKKILFSMRRNISDDYHIYEIDINGANVGQLTFGGMISDIDPFYLPDGRIGFTSTREPKYCMCNVHIMGNICVMDADGANIHQIGRNTLHSGHGFVMPDGRIMYDRWEYVDRNFGDAQGLWTVNPDGTNHAVYLGNNTGSPGAFLEGIIIPGTQQILCILGSCHDRPWGAMAIVDRRLGLDNRGPVLRTWPTEAIDKVGRGDLDTFKRFSQYEDPYPLSDKYFICSHRVSGKESMEVYLLDVFGNETQLISEQGNNFRGCYDARPIKERVRPKIIPTRRNFKNEPGCFYVVDVYNGTHMKGVKRGSIKYMRVVETPPKKFWTSGSWGGQGMQAPAMNWHSFENKIIHGTVPVEQDGSVYTEVPSDKFLYFQLLDAEGMMVHSMRSGTMIQSGETTGCVGCHDNRRAAPPPIQHKTPLALQRPASKLNGWYGPAREFSYLKEVQPVFDKHCVKCHDFGKKAGEKLVLAGDRDNIFNASYNELQRKKYIKVVGGGPSGIQQAYSWGSHVSKIVKQIRSGHKDVKLSKEEFDRVVGWIDINAVYYPDYSCAYPNNLYGRSPLDRKQISRLKEHTGVNFNTHHNRNVGPQISFDRPELSPYLAAIKDKNSPEYSEALAIIRQGAVMLKSRPGVDMDGYVPCLEHQKRQKTYEERYKQELLNRKAILADRKVYCDRKNTQYVER